MAVVGASTAPATVLVAFDPVGGARVVGPVGSEEIAFIGVASGVSAFVRAVGPGPTPVSPEVLGGTVTQEPYPEWFERIHIVPSTTIEFGNILAQQDRTFEIYNAYANLAVTLTSIVNNVQPGIEFPNLTAPQTLQPGASFLRPSSTFDPPVPVQDIVRALVDGLPSFNGTVLFSFDDGSVLSLTLSGSRIALLVEFYENEFTETLVFGTEVLTSLSGKEQRIAYKKQPTQQFVLQYRLTGTDRQRFQYRLFDWQTNTFGLPLWHEQKRLTAPAGAGASQVQIPNTSGSDLRVGGNVVIYKNPSTFDIATVVSATSTVVTIDTALNNAYAAGDILAPVRVAEIVNVSSKRSKVAIEEWTLTLNVTDNDTGAPAGDLSFFAEYDGRPYLDNEICNAMFSASTIEQGFSKALIVLQNPSGNPFRTSTQPQNKRRSTWGVDLSTPAGILAFRRALIGLRGRQASFWIRTYFDDVTPTGAITIGGTTVDVANVGYGRFVRSRQRFKILRVQLADGTELFREVLSSTEVSPTVERLTVGASWGVDASVDEIVLAEFLELARLDADRIQLNRNGIDRAECRLPLVTVFDEV